MNQSIYYSPFCGRLLLYSQDTNIKTRRRRNDPSPKVIEVSERSQARIWANKSDISSIHYLNGEVDTFRLQQPSPYLAMARFKPLPLLMAAI